MGQNMGCRANLIGGMGGGDTVWVGEEEGRSCSFILFFFSFGLRLVNSEAAFVVGDGLELAMNESLRERLCD